MIPMIGYPRWTANAIDTGMIVTTFSAKIRSRSRDALSIAAKGCADKPRMPLGSTGVRNGLPAEGRWIRTIGPALHTHRFGPPLVGSVTVPFAKTEITFRDRVPSVRSPEHFGQIP